MSIEDFLRQSLMQSSVESYIYDINKYKSNNKNANKYDYQKVMQYIEILRNEHSISNVKRVIASIKKYYHYLIIQNKDKPKFERSCLYFGYQYNLYSNVPCLLYYNPILLRVGYAEITEPTGMNFVFK